VLCGLGAGHKVAEFLFRKATTEGPQCVTAAIFWMKTRSGWRETPQSHEIAIKPASEMTDAELEARIREIDVTLGRPMIELKPAQIRARSKVKLGVMPDECSAMGERRQQRWPMIRDRLYTSAWCFHHA
jgi:hypothetical protein